MACDNMTYSKWTQLPRAVLLTAIYVSVVLQFYWFPAAFYPSSLQALGAHHEPKAAQLLLAGIRCQRKSKGA